MYVLLIALASNFSTSLDSKTGKSYIHSRTGIITYQIDYSSKEKCNNALNEMNRPNNYMKPVFLKCLPK